MLSYFEYINESKLKLIRECAGVYKIINVLHEDTGMTLNQNISYGKKWDLIVHETSKGSFATKHDALVFLENHLVELSESYVNLFISDVDDRNKYVDQVWDILQQSYKKIGGIKGNGFNNKEEMVNKIPFWKLNVKNGKVKTVVMYKDKTGRKFVASGTDGTAEAVSIISTALLPEMKRSFGEKSGAALGLVAKTIPFDILKPFLFLQKDVSKAIGKDISKPNVNELNSDDLKTWEKLPHFKPYFYIRYIGGEPHMKVLMGTDKIRIK